MSDTPMPTLSVAQLEQYLWSAADILRGSIDSSDYKTYIFGLLFLKRLSDRFEEEAEKLIAEGVLAGIDYNDERKLGDAKNRDTVLARLVQHFSQVFLRNDRMAEPGSRATKTSTTRCACRRTRHFASSGRQRCGTGVRR